MTVSSGNKVVNVLDKKSLNGTILLSFDILQVIRMHNTNNMIKFIGPALPMVVPVQMLRLFQNCYVGFL
jgi:hypothetical protein